ncbi:MAG: hypothetical protein H7287_07545 [Thermoleophilia bacterium]|nr:hypothetical protein [Thermoleophilia bacterium]
MPHEFDLYVSSRGFDDAPITASFHAGATFYGPVYLMDARVRGVSPVELDEEGPAFPDLRSTNLEGKLQLSTVRNGIDRLDVTGGGLSLPILWRGMWAPEFIDGALTFGPNIRPEVRENAKVQVKAVAFALHAATSSTETDPAELAELFHGEPCVELRIVRSESIGQGDHKLTVATVDA